MSPVRQLKFLCKGFVCEVLRRGRTWTQGPGLLVQTKFGVVNDRDTKTRSMNLRDTHLSCYNSL